MNVLLLTQFYSSGSTGGGDYVFYLIADMLAKNGHRVWVVTTEIKDNNIRQHKNIKFIFPVSEINRRKKRRFKDNLLYTFKAIKFGLSLNKNEKIDIIHSNTGVPFPAIAGSIISIFTNIPHFVTIHHLVSIFPDYWKQFSKENSKINAILGPFFEKLQIKVKSAAIHVVHESVRENLIKFGVKKKIFVIHNAIPNTKIEKLPVVPLQFFFVGRLVFYKNVQTVIKSIRLVKHNYPNVKLIIAGDGPYKKKLEELSEDLDLKNNIIFKGFVSDEEKRKLMATSHALIFPSLVEGFGLVILEAFSQKIPILVSDVRPLSDIVEHKKTGLLVPPHDEKAWAQAIEFLIQTPKKAEEMGSNGFNELEKKYNLEFMGEQILKMYNDFVKK